MENTLQTILHDFVTQYPRPDEPAQLELTVGTHDPNRDTTKFRNQCLDHAAGTGCQSE